VTGSISGKYITAVDHEGEFAAALTQLVKEHRPTCIIETGTHHGTGTTAAILRGLRELPESACRFFSIEVNPANYQTARKNLEASGDLSRATLLNGLSIPRSLLPERETLRRDLADANIEAGLYVDFPENIRADGYFAETNHPGLPDDLLGACLEECGGKPELVVLDSAGHVGFAEFRHVVDRLRGPCLIALDDTRHVKHRESLRYMKDDPRFRILREGEEKFGFCLAEFTPAPQGDPS
jgi:hypothetical protein